LRVRAHPGEGDKGNPEYVRLAERSVRALLDHDELLMAVSGTDGDHQPMTCLELLEQGWGTAGAAAVTRMPS